eukprot:g6865.t1
MQYTTVAYQPSQWVGGGLFDCFSDCSSCCLTCCCPCITYAEIGQLLDRRGGCSYVTDLVLYCLVADFTGCQCVLGLLRRSDVRAKYNLVENPCNDFCVHCFCHCCALCQEYRELTRRAQATVTVVPTPVMIPTMVSPAMGAPAPVVADPVPEMASAPPKAAVI